MASVTICAWSAGKSWITICHCKRTRSRVSKEDKAIYRMILEGMRGIFFIAFRKVPTKNIIFTYSLKPTLTFGGIPPRQWSIDFKIMTSQFPPDNMTKRQKDSIYKMVFYITLGEKKSSSGVEQRRAKVFIWWICPSFVPCRYNVAITTGHPITLRDIIRVSSKSNPGMTSWNVWQSK